MEINSLVQKASSLETPLNILHELSTHESELIRAAVASNPNTSEDTILSLVGDTSLRVLDSLSTNTSKFTLNFYEYSATYNSKLSIISVDDAEFVVSLRKKPELNRHLSYVDTDIDKQKKWIINYKEREAKRTEFYFIIKDMNNNKLGAIRVYDFKPGSFCWGSWIIDPNSPRKTAIESALNIYEFGFNVLGFSQSHFDVRNENLKVINFHKRMGANVINNNDVDTFFEFKKAYYNQTKSNYKQFLLT